MSIVKCEVVEIDGNRHWQALEFVSDNKKHAFFAGTFIEKIMSVLKDGSVIDHREDEFFRERGILPGTQILPCPSCLVPEDKGHISARHIDPNLGINTDVYNILVDRATMALKNRVSSADILDKFLGEQVKPLWAKLALNDAKRKVL